MMKNAEMRKKLGEIVSSENEENWWKPKLFEKNTKSQLSKGIEILKPPPKEEVNYNCFVYVLKLENNRDFLGKDNWDFTRNLGKIFDQMIHKGLLTKTNKPNQGDIIIYRTRDGSISHAGLKNRNNKIISKWSWGPLIKHSVFDVPNHYGDIVEFYNLSSSAKDFVINLRNKNNT